MGAPYLNNDQYMARLTEAEYDEEIKNWEWGGIPDDIGVYTGVQQEIGVDVTLPHKYVARDYQADHLWKPFFIDLYRRLAVIWHRRAGKDKSIWNLTIAAAQQEVGLYFYMLPKVVQARKVIWDGRGKDGISFRDHLPDDLVVKMNTSTMTIYLANGSIIQLVGSDNYDALMGTNPIGIVFSEYALQDPNAWDYFRPILAENGGWAIMDYTPRGHNHGKKLSDMADKSDNWYHSILTVDDTRREDGTPVVTEEAIQAERDEGMSEDKVQQEFYCSFDAANQGAIFGKQMSLARKQGRITSIPMDPRLRTYTFWDIGWRDYMAIWVMQPYSSTQLRMVAYYQDMLMGMDHYINWLIDLQKENRLVFDTHYAPHDIEVHDVMSGKSRVETAKEMGIEFETVPRTKHKGDSLEAARQVFPAVWFDEERCERGIDALTSYEYRYDEKNKVYREPHHNWASNGADAFQQFAMVWRDEILQDAEGVETLRKGRGFM